MMQKIWEEHVALSAGHELIKMYFTSLGKRSPSSLQLELEGGVAFSIININIYLCMSKSKLVGGSFSVLAAVKSLTSLVDSHHIL